MPGKIKECYLKMEIQEDKLERRLLKLRGKANPFLKSFTSVNEIEGTRGRLQARSLNASMEFDNSGKWFNNSRNNDMTVINQFKLPSVTQD